MSTVEEKDKFKAMCATIVQSSCQILELKAVTDDGLVEFGVRPNLVPMVRDDLRSFEIDLKRRRGERKIRLWEHGPDGNVTQCPQM